MNEAERQLHDLAAVARNEGLPVPEVRAAGHEGATAVWRFGGDSAMVSVLLGRAHWFAARLNAEGRVATESDAWDDLRPAIARLRAFAVAR